MAQGGEAACPHSNQKPIAHLGTKSRTPGIQPYALNRSLILLYCKRERINFLKESIENYFEFLLEGGLQRVDSLNYEKSIMGTHQL